jgi:hypothetical protein
MKTELTRLCELAIHIHCTDGKLGVYGAPEVGMDGDTWLRPKGEKLGIVDYITIEQHRNGKPIIRCYEVKVSLADFRSKHPPTWVGHLNYWVMPETLYEAVKDGIEDGIGAYTVSSTMDVKCVRRAKAREALLPADAIREKMMRAMSREYNKRAQGLYWRLRGILRMAESGSMDLTPQKCYDELRCERKQYEQEVLAI